ncbi:uncharacterized protein KD926_004881 [Aspergillus affinis]|uniref:uncharacterized protein n=1 Tax=Aspergillus affinis TaxID=1070780 RepID=UPI0022FE4D55|nr:uncharacterized protein KD926_004881 [Aspergillus affinis]KAI9042816.1 hypothetical protein KD926_004881 [Aspergillus affinis]
MVCDNQAKIILEEDIFHKLVFGALVTFHGPAALPGGQINIHDSIGLRAWPVWQCDRRNEKQGPVRDFDPRGTQKFALVSELFVVTGMKLVKGAKIKYSTLQSTTVKGNLGIDVNMLGTIFEPKGHWTSTNNDATQSNRESEFVFAFRVKRLKIGRKLKLEEYNKGAFMTVSGGKDNDECILVEDVNGANIRTAEAVPDVTENGNVYCVPV